MTTTYQMFIVLEHLLQLLYIPVTINIATPRPNPHIKHPPASFWKRPCFAGPYCILCHVILPLMKVHLF